MRCGLDAIELSLSACSYSLIIYTYTVHAGCWLLMLDVFHDEFHLRAETLRRDTMRGCGRGRTCTVHCMYMTVQSFHSHTRSLARRPMEGLSKGNGTLPRKQVLRLYLPLDCRESLKTCFRVRGWPTGHTRIRVGAGLAGGLGREHT